MPDFPSQPIRLVTAALTGSDTDMLARLIAQGISGPLGQPVTVENQAGFGAGEMVSKAPPDGHTLLLTGGNLWYGSLLQKTPYDPVRDFSPITLAAISPLIVVVHPSVAANSIAELIALAKAQPGKLSYGSGLNGSSSQLAAGLFTHMAGLDIGRVPYSIGLVGVNNLIAGKVHFMIPSAGSAMSQVKAGKLRALAVTSAGPSAVAPRLPTVASILPGYEMVQTLALFAPANTPAPVIQRINRETVTLLKSEGVKEHLLSEAVEVVGSSPEELRAKMISDMVKWDKVIKDVGIRAN